MGPLGRANLAEACSSLLTAKHRAVLALIGIAVGVASVSSMISVGAIARAEAARQFQELGTDILKVRLRPQNRDAGRISVPLADAQGIAALPSIARAAPYTVASSHVVLGGTEPALARVVGAALAFAGLARLELAEGRFVSRLDGGRYFCTLGADLATALAEARGGRAVGETVRIGETVFTVVGTLRRVAMGQRPFDVNETVFIPIETAARVTPRETLRDILARMSPGTHWREAATELRAWFEQRLPAARVRVRSAEELIEQMHRQRRLYTLLLGAVGGIALLVGGVGVMNVMLVAVTERRREIGIRRALGATRRDIQGQFLAETLILSLAGGLVGILLGLGATFGICRFTGWEFALSWGGTALGAVVSGGAGVFFGFYPAYQAARLDPVTALQGA